MKQWLLNLVKTFFKRYHWGFMLAGSVTFALAATSWVLESSETYWIWHRYDIITTLLPVKLTKASQLSGTRWGPAPLLELLIPPPYWQF